MARGRQFNTGLTATYRLQFHKDFPFHEGAKLAPYLRDLGVSHVYASPIMQAKPGSTHGYDVTDFARINAELGGEAGLRAMCAALREAGVGVILDIVPNHMAVGGADNPYWLDLLEKGQDSAYADFFDVDFDAPGLDGKILVPFLGASYCETLAKGELELKARPDRHGAYAVYFHEHCFPVREVDRRALDAEGLTVMNQPERLHALLEAQHYRLASWRTANDRLNYRRFFEITALAGVRIERPGAFDKMHRVPLQLYAEGLIDGVRVDHIDGLTDPAGYCETLRARLDARRNERPPGRRVAAYIVAEKILAGDELAPPWPIDGTTGYDFMNEVSALQHSDAPALRDAWVALTGRPGDFDVEETAARGEMLARNFVGQLDAAVELLHKFALKRSGDRDFTRGAMRRAVVAVIRNLRVYRSYALGGAENPGAGAHLQRALAAAFAEPTRDDPALRMLEEILNSRDDDPALRAAIGRFNQLTAPIAAKAVEDTAFYRYGVLLSRNDVGFDAAHMSMPFREFHRRMHYRAQAWPHAMLTTATHDHKRGEDARARLAVLSEVPDEWLAQCAQWRAANGALGGEIDPADAHMLYQTLVSAWPHDLAADDAQGLAALTERIVAWQNKALREGKLRSSWLTPNADYERAAEAFARALLDPRRSAPFLAQLRAFVGRIASAGMANGLTQVALRCLAPGVPDLYRGAELWDFSLVDPDNRRPVDYEMRRRLIAQDSADIASGAIKLKLIQTLLGLRRREPELFAFGDYAPLELAALDGAAPFGFVRRFAGKTLVVALSLRAGPSLFGTPRLTPEARVWGDARLGFDLAGYAPILACAPGADLRLARVFEASPVAVWLKG